MKKEEFKTYDERTVGLCLSKLINYKIILSNGINDPTTSKEILDSIESRKEEVQNCILLLSVLYRDIVRSKMESVYMNISPDNVSKEINK